MNFGKTTKIESLPLTPDLPGILYPRTDPDGPVDVDRDVLMDIVRLLGPVIGTLPKGFSLFVVKEAMDAFCSYADGVYKTSHKEATGLFMGYYVHAPEDPDIRVGIATTFLEAHGDASTVTCEISFEDCIRAMNYGQKHHQQILVWPHSHPGFGVFYSGTDSTTLQTSFNADQHAGIVVDNLQDRYLAYKIIDGRQEQIPIWGFSLQEFRRTGEAELFQYPDGTAPVPEVPAVEEETQAVPEPVPSAPVVPLVGALVILALVACCAVVMHNLRKI